jgi:7-cyano-7-deazaguanine synthase
MIGSGRNALVMFSGGQDSTTCLAWALERFDHVETVGFSYGQRHAAELDARPRIIERLRTDFPRWRNRLGDDHHLSLNVLAEIGGSALTDEIAIEMGENGLPTTFVPGRNLMFLTASASLGYRLGIADLVGGMCGTDYSGYPDCRDGTMKAMQHALELGFARNFAVHTPLMFIDKAGIWALAEQLGEEKLISVIVEETVTCYRGISRLDPKHRHDWGYGCNDCPACALRASGYARYRDGVEP